MDALLADLSVAGLGEEQKPGPLDDLDDAGLGEEGGSDLLSDLVSAGEACAVNAFAVSVAFEEFGRLIDDLAAAGLETTPNPAKTAPPTPETSEKQAASEPKTEPRKRKKQNPEPTLNTAYVAYLYKVC